MINFLLVMLTVGIPCKYEYDCAQYVAPYVYQRSQVDLGPLLKPEENCYGCDEICKVSARPLFSGELEGLPLYNIFDQEVGDIAGFEFRKIYVATKQEIIPECGCYEMASVDYEGFSVSISMEEKFIYMIFKL